MRTTSLNKITSLIDKISSTNDGYLYAVFDFDNTCIINDIEEASFAFICENRLLKDFSLLNQKY